MAIVSVGVSDEGFVIMTIKDEGNAADVIVPMRPDGAHSIASDLMRAASVAASKSTIPSIVLPEGIQRP